MPRLRKYHVYTMWVKVNAFKRKSALFEQDYFYALNVTDTTFEKRRIFSQLIEMKLLYVSEFDELGSKMLK